MESIAACFKNSFKKFPEKTAITFLRRSRTETKISFKELDLNSNKIANMLLMQGIKKSDRIVLILDKSLIFIVLHIALQKIGAVCIPLNPGFKESELKYFLNDAEPALVMVEPDKSETIKQINNNLNCMIIDTGIPFQKINFFQSFSDDLKETTILSDDPALIIYTSGTTGDPKGAVLTQKNLVHDAENIIHIWEISSSDTICHALPLFHVHGLCFALHTALISGAHTIMTDKFTPKSVIKILKTSKGDMSCSVFMGVPAMYLKLIDYITDLYEELREPKRSFMCCYETNLCVNPDRPHGRYMENKRSFNFDHIRLWTSGSAPLLTKHFHKIKQIFGREPVEREGMSETGMNFSNPLHGKKKPGSIGIPLPGLEVRIVDPDTSLDVSQGQTGEFWLKSDSIIREYWKKPEATEKAFNQGWFKTGDLGKKDEDGYYYLTDRIKNIIITGGENVSPNEIEKVINLLDDVVESSVAGVADEKWGEKIAAAIVKTHNSGDISNEVMNICKKHLHDWKCPKKIVFVDKLPKNTMGKVLKEEIKKILQKE